MTERTNQDRTMLDEQAPETLAEAHLTVRVEVAHNTISVREWQATEEGHLFLTRTPPGKTVTLRVGGVVVGLGELCVVDDELAVRLLKKYPLSEPASEDPSA